MFVTARGPSAAVAQWGLLPLVVVHRFLIVAASLVAEHWALGHPGFSSCITWAAEHGLGSGGVWA